MPCQTQGFLGEWARKIQNFKKYWFGAWWLFGKFLNFMNQESDGLAPLDHACNRSNAVGVSVVNVGEMGVAVGQGLVPVPVGMRLTGRVGGQMAVLMVRIVHVAMTVFQRCVGVQVFVPLAQVQPDPQSHQRPGDQEWGGHRFTQHPQGERSAYKRSR